MRDVSGANPEVCSAGTRCQPPGIGAGPELLTERFKMRGIDHHRLAQGFGSGCKDAVSRREISEGDDFLWKGWFFCGVQPLVLRVEILQLAGERLRDFSKRNPDKNCLTVGWCK
jgi:hypothetical protein